MSTTVNDKETIEYRTSFPTGYRVASVASMFDLEAGEDRVNTISYTAPPSASEDWTIGLIVGPSGSGKSSVARKHFDADIFRGHAWSSGPIINDFADDLSVETIIKLFRRSVLTRRRYGYSRTRLYRTARSSARI